MLFILCFFYYVDAGEKKIAKRKRGDSSVPDKEQGKGKKKMKEDSRKEEVKEDIFPENVMKQLMKSLLQNSLVKAESDEDNESKQDKKAKKKEKVLSEDEVKHRDYLEKFPILQARSAPTALHTAIHAIKKVDIDKFLAEIGFGSFIKFDINKIPSRLGRYVVENFDAETCRLKLEGDKYIQATVSKVHELLGIPIGGKSLLSLETRAVDDDFENVWFSQFEGKSAKQIRVNDIAGKLIEAKEVDFLFKVNFLTLFSNTTGMVAGLQGEINFDVVKHLHEDTDIRSIDWCEYIFHCLKLSRKPTTVQNKYTGPYTLLVVSFILDQVLNCFHVSVTYLLQLSYTFLFFVFCFQLLYLDSTNFKKLPVLRTRPAIKHWSSFLMAQRQEMELKEEYFGKSDLFSESDPPETEGFFAGGSSESSYKQVRLILCFL